MNSVLLVGNHSFTTSVITQVRGLDSLTVRVASSVLKATQLIARATPDVVITQANQLIEGSVSKTFDRDVHGFYLVVDTTSPPLPEFFQLEKTAIALEAGADAYLWLQPLDLITASATLDPALNPALDPALPPAQQRLKKPPPITFHQSQCRLMQAHIQLGLSQAQRYRDLSRLNNWLSAIALVDALTQLNNRRAFDLEMPRQVEVARTQHKHLSLMVLDIDYFKAVNDRYGHLVGDEVLKHVAKRLLANMRFYDAPFRYGGEEFVVILNNTDAQEAILIAERLRHSIEHRPFELSHLVPISGEKSQLQLTLSIGLTELRADDDDQGHSFLNRADQNLLQAKASGRNQVVSDLVAGGSVASDSITRGSVTSHSVTSE